MHTALIQNNVNYQNKINYIGILQFVGVQKIYVSRYNGNKIGEEFKTLEICKKNSSKYCIVNAFEIVVWSKHDQRKKELFF